MKLAHAVVVQIYLFFFSIFLRSLRTLKVVPYPDTTQTRSDQLVLSLRALVERASDLRIKKDFVHRGYCSSSIDSFIALMDENTICLWLKDYQDAMENLAQQQAAAFQALFDILRAELKATRGLLQNRQGAGVIKRELVSKPTTLGDVFSLARTIEARFDDQVAPVSGTPAILEGNKQAIDVESTTDNNARDQASELETKLLVDGKQDEAKIVKVVDVPDEQQ
nr:hypothetical protein [Tanacetum cinerariifolium]